MKIRSYYFRPFVVLEENSNNKKGIGDIFTGYILFRLDLKASLVVLKTPRLDIK